MAVSPEKLIDRILSKFSKIKDPKNFRPDQALLSLQSYFYSQENCLWSPTAKKDQFEARKFLDPPAILYTETVTGSSKIKENLQKVKYILEVRIAVKAFAENSSSPPKDPEIDYTKFKSFQDVLDYFNFSIEDCRRALEECFEDRVYTRREIEEGMKLDFITITSDIPYASQTIESIFGVAPHK